MILERRKRESYQTIVKYEEYQPFKGILLSHNEWLLLKVHT